MTKGLAFKNRGHEPFTELVKVDEMELLEEGGLSSLCSTGDQKLDLRYLLAFLSLDDPLFIALLSF